MSFTRLRKPAGLRRHQFLYVRRATGGKGANVVPPFQSGYDSGAAIFPRELAQLCAERGWEFAAAKGEDCAFDVVIA